MLKKVQNNTNISPIISIILVLGSLYGSYSSAQDRLPQAGRRTDPPKGDVTESPNKKPHVPRAKDQTDLAKTQKQKFENLFSQVLSEPAKNVIIEKCGNWRNLNSQQWNVWRQECGQSIKYSPQFDSLRGDLGVYADWQQIFPVEGHPDIPGFAQDIQEISQKEGIIRKNYISSHSQGDIRGERRSSMPVPAEYNILTYSEAAVFMKKIREAPFLQNREKFLENYGCSEKGYPSSSILDCYNSTVAQRARDKNCIEESGFKKCKPILDLLNKCPEGGNEASSCVRGVLALHECTERKNAQSIVALASELSKDDKNSMVYVCWKAATQGAQCCINPDQCPTDGAFRNIASQLQKAAPGLVQAFAGLEAIKGNYQAACEANLMANAAGPLSQLQTKTCGDSATACEETCDKKVQEFKESFKQAVLGGQPQGKKQEEKPLTIDEIVDTATRIEGPMEETLIATRSSDDSDTDTDTKITEDITTCAQAVVYLNSKFKEKTEDKKTIKLSEKLSHASLVDCTEEVFKHAGGSSGGANPASGLGGMNPMAAQMCRQGHPDGPQSPRLPVVGPTPNPGMGPGHLFGSKTRKGPGGNFTAPGAGVPPPDEFIEPERGPAGATALNGGWTDTGSGMGPGGSSSPGGSGLPGSPSRDDEGGSGDTGDNLPIAYPEAFDSGGGGFDGGGDMGSEGSPLMQMAKYMEKKDTEEARKEEEKRLKEIDAQGSIFSRLSQTIRAYCQQENCPEE